LPKHKVDVPSLLMTLCFTANVIVCLYDRNSILIQKEVGILVFAIGSALFIYSIFYIRTGFLGETEPKLEKLVTKGLYRLCRHPIYLSFIVMTLGIDLATRSITGLVLTFALSVPSAVNRVIVEERLLKAKFGESWLNYAREVGFMFPKFPTKARFTEIQADEMAS